MEHSYGLHETIAISQADGIILTTITTSDSLNIPISIESNKSVEGEKSCENEVTNAHCLICNSGLTPNADETYNIFTRLKALRTEESRASVFEKVGQILSRSLCTIHLHSETICRQCFSLVVDYDTLEYKLELIRDDITVKFDRTAACQRPPERMDQVQGVEENDKENSRGNQSGNNFVLVVNNSEVVSSEFNMQPSSNLKKNKKLKMKKVKSGSKNYSCPVCGKCFTAFSHRVEHMLIHIGEKPFACEICKRSFRTRSALKVHSMKHTGDRPYRCDHCGKSFTDKYYFEEHARIHTGEKPYSCSFCSRTFTRKKDMKVHIKSHTGDKPHKCSSCTKSFAVKSRLERHLKIHSGVKPHVCQYCNKQFSRKDDYKVHMRVHTGEKPFHCGICRKAFTNQSNCLAHVRTHSGIKPYKCSMCNLGFDRKAKVEQHILDSHNQPVQEIQFVQEATSHEVTTLPQNIHQLQASQEAGTQNIEIHAQFPSVSQQLTVETSQTSNDTETSSLLGTQGVTVSELHALPVQSIQGLPVGQVAQVTWTSGSPGQATTTTVPLTGTYVNIGTGAFVNIVN